MKHTLLSLLLLMATFYSGLAQHQYREERIGAAIAGTIIDAQTGEPLSFATVVVKGTTLTVANKNGAFLSASPSGRTFYVAASMVGIAYGSSG